MYPEIQCSLLYNNILFLAEKEQMTLEQYDDLLESEKLAIEYKYFNLGDEDLKACTSTRMYS